MKRTLLPLMLLGLVATATANPRYILRYTESEPLPTFLARYQLRLEATVASRPIHAVVDPLNRRPADLIARISNDTDDDVSIEPDQILRLPILSLRTRQSNGMDALANSLRQTTPVNFYGVSAPVGATTQTNLGFIEANRSWTAHGLGTGTVAVIDTGVDVNHPFFRGYLVPGIDFLTPGASGSELTGLSNDVLALINPTTTPLLRTAPVWLSNGTAPVFPAATASDPRFRQIPIGLGHGTMVAGAVRLVAPRARILPIRAFQQNGTGRLFHVISAMHAAEMRGAKVVNLSLNTYTYSPELERSGQELSDRGVILVASTGNDGLTNVLSYPAAVDKVTGVASVSRQNVRSLFSNAGVDLTTVSAPGEALMLPFPGARWAGGWGTSFSAPLVSGLASKMLVRKPDATYSDLQSALGRSAPTGNVHLGMGRLNVYDSMAGL